MWGGGRGGDMDAARVFFVGIEVGDNQPASRLLEWGHKYHIVSYWTCVRRAEYLPCFTCRNTTSEEKGLFYSAECKKRCLVLST